jgi:hypothetical protein
VVALPLVIVRGTMAARRYGLHRLTESFMLNEVISGSKRAFSLHCSGLFSSLCVNDVSSTFDQLASLAIDRHACFVYWKAPAFLRLRSRPDNVRGIYENAIMV